METKTFETPFKKFKVEIKTFLTAKDEFEIQKILYDAAEFSGGEVKSVKGSAGDVMINMEKKLLEVAVMSINGSKEKIVQGLLEMPSEDYNFIKAEIDKTRDYVEVKKNS